MARSDATTDGSSETPANGPSDTVADVYDALAPIYDGVGGAQAFAMMVAERLERLFAVRRQQAARMRRRKRCPSMSCPFSISGAGPGRCSAPCGCHIPVGAWRASTSALGCWRSRAARRAATACCGCARGSRGRCLSRRGSTSSAPSTTRSTTCPTSTRWQRRSGPWPRCCARGACFVFDLNNAFGFETWWRYGVAFDVAGHHIASELGYDRHTRTGRAAIGLSRDGLERRFLLRQRCFSDSEVEGALLQAGFTPEIAAPWAAVNANSPSKTWFVASKRHDQRR